MTLYIRLPHGQIIKATKDQGGSPLPHDSEFHSRNWRSKYQPHVGAKHRSKLSMRILDNAIAGLTPKATA